MFRFTTFHVIENPRGHAPGFNYSLVGAVPAVLMDEKPVTPCQSEECACRKLFGTPTTSPEE